MPDREPTPEFVSAPDITENDLLQLDIELQNIGVGTVNHIMRGTMAACIMRFNTGKEGWTESSKEKFLTDLGKIKNYIAAEKVLRAMREKSQE